MTRGNGLDRESVRQNTGEEKFVFKERYGKLIGHVERQERLSKTLRLISV